MMSEWAVVIAVAIIVAGISMWANGSAFLIGQRVVGLNLYCTHFDMRQFKAVNTTYSVPGYIGGRRNCPFWAE